MGSAKSNLTSETGEVEDQPAQKTLVRTVGLIPMARKTFSIATPYSFPSRTWQKGNENSLH